MPKTITTLEARRRIGTLLDRIAVHNEELVIERKGKALAALVPLARLEQMRRFARRQALDFLDDQRGGSLGEERSMTLALEAQRSVRARAKRARHRTG